MPKGYASVETTAQTAAHITTWWARNTARLPHYTPQELERALGMSMRGLAAPLELCAWYRVKVWGRVRNKRVLRVCWVPHGGTPPQTTRGRPRYDVMAMLG